jgi:hypothetical protein
VAGFWLLLRVFHFHFLRFSSSWIVLLPDIFIRPLFGGFHCFGYSSGQGSGCCLPVWVWRIVYLWSSNFFAVFLLLHLGSCHPKLVVFVASKINRNLVDSIDLAIRLVKVLAAASRSGFGG